MNRTVDEEASAAVEAVTFSASFTAAAFFSSAYLRCRLLRLHLLHPPSAAFTLPSASLTLTSSHSPCLIRSASFRRARTRLELLDLPFHLHHLLSSPPAARSQPPAPPPCHQPHALALTLRHEETHLKPQLCRLSLCVAAFTRCSSASAAASAAPCRAFCIST